MEPCIGERSLEFKLEADDGAVVYVNGVEVYRAAMVCCCTFDRFASLTLAIPLQHVGPVDSSTFVCFVYSIDEEVSSDHVCVEKG